MPRPLKMDTLVSAATACINAVTATVDLSVGECRKALSHIVGHDGCVNNDDALRAFMVSLDPSLENARPSTLRKRFYTLFGAREVSLWGIPVWDASGGNAVHVGYVAGNPEFTPRAETPEPERPTLTLADIATK